MSWALVVAIAVCAFGAGFFVALACVPSSRPNRRDRRGRFVK